MVRDMNNNDTTTKSAREELAAYLEELFAGEQGERLRASIAARLRGERGRVPLMAAMRDDCPCGSGVKYEQCCHAKVLRLRNLVARAKREARAHAPDYFIPRSVLRRTTNIR